MKTHTCLTALIPLLERRGARRAGWLGVCAFVVIFLLFFTAGHALAETRAFTSTENMKKKADEERKKEKEIQHDAEFPDLQQTLKWANDQIKAAKTLDELKDAQQAINSKLIRGMYLNKGR